MMTFNLTDNQKEILSWIVDNIRSKTLEEEFELQWVSRELGFVLTPYSGTIDDLPRFTKGVIDAFVGSGLMICSILHSTVSGKTFEGGRICTLTGSAYEAVDSDFAAPDTSYLLQLTPLADTSTLDEEIVQRCLPILGAGSADPKLWDSAVRTAGVILEDRLRAAGGISEEGLIGRDLVNHLFGQDGILSGAFKSDSEKLGYRDLYAGVVGAFRNPYSHRLVDPTPEDGGAFIVFVNLLLKMLHDLL